MVEETVCLKPELSVLGGQRHRGGSKDGKGRVLVAEWELQVPPTGRNPRADAILGHLRSLCFYRGPRRPMSGKGFMRGCGMGRRRFWGISCEQG